MTAYVYVLAVGGEDGPFRRPVKIGITKNPEQRLAGMRPHSPLPLSYVKLISVKDIHVARAIEIRVHSLLGDTRLAYEWFDTEPSTAVYFVETIREMRP